MSFALLALLTKSVTHQTGHGVATALGGWQLYLLVGLGVAALVIPQSAYQAGPLALSMPAIATVEPVAVVGLIVLVLLAISPTVLSVYERARRDAPGRSAGGGGDSTG